eukprot:1161227-Pelagomonas_calceolata.AAC.8
MVYVNGVVLYDWLLDSFCKMDYVWVLHGALVLPLTTGFIPKKVCLSLKNSSYRVTTVIANPTRHLQAAAEEAQSREVAVARKLLTKEAEIGSLKGEVEAAKSMARARTESIQGQFKARIHDLEVQVGQHREHLRLGDGDGVVMENLP